jgi:hypothetical protein
MIFTGNISWGKTGNLQATSFPSSKEVKIDDPLFLHIDLMETDHEFPLKISTICCTLDELSHNVKLISREIFRLKNLKELE